MALRNVPIRRKLTIIILGTTAAGLLLMAAGFFVHEYFSFRRNALRQLETFAQIVAANSTAALAFQNRDDADSVLRALHANPRIRAAAIYNKDNTVLSHYPETAPPSHVPATPPPDGYRFEPGRIVGVQPVVQARGSSRLGTLYLEADRTAMYETFRLYGAITLLVAGISFGAAYLLARRLQHTISAPVLTLADTARAVSDRRDYSVRATRQGDDEIGLLTDAFNHMLSRIEEQTHALRESEARVRAVLNSSLISVFVTDDSGRINDWNARAETMFGWRRDEAIGRTLRNTIVATAPSAADGFIDRSGRPLPTRQHETVAIRRDGTTFPVELSISPIGTGDQITYCGFVTDITERKLAEQRVRAQMERLALLSHITRAISERQDLPSIFNVAIRSIEESMPVDFGCVCLYDRLDNMLTVSAVGARSAHPAATLGMPAQARIPIDENGLARCVRGHLVYEPDTRHVPFPFPRRLAEGGLHAVVIAPLRVESSVFGVLIAARRAAQSFSSGDCEFLRQLSEHVALASNQAQVYTALQEAYDELRQTQQTAVQQERLRALGQMASGIAHDINNAISPISLYAEALLAKEPLSERAREYLDTIRHSIDDVAQTVMRMREFYRPREPQLALAPVDINRVMERVHDVTRARWFDMPQQRGVVIDVRREFTPDLPPIMGVESEIREAMINLIFNAVDAMPGGGTLTLRTRLANASPAGASVAPARVIVEVRDTGVGMNEDTRRRCLEPFFTTKGERGTGLGLAMVYGTVKRHNADIEIDTKPGDGTTIRLAFPVPANPNEVVLIGDYRPPRPQRLRLLLVDDDPVLLKSLRDTLVDDGHDVVTANGGQTGIDAFLSARREGRPFAAVITDLGMPYVDGRRVAAAVKEASAATPVFMLTGWGQRLVAEGDIPPHVDRVLNKPPKLRDLREVLVTVLPPATPP